MKSLMVSGLNGGKQASYLHEAMWVCSISDSHCAGGTAGSVIAPLCHIIYWMLGYCPNAATLKSYYSAVLLAAAPKI